MTILIKIQFSHLLVIIHSRSKLMSQKKGNTQAKLHKGQMVQSSIVHLSVSYWGAQKGTTVPHIWQPPQITQLAAGIWPNCGIHGGVKTGGETTGEGGRQGRHGRGWVDGGLAMVGKLLSVKCLEPLDKTSFPGSASFSSFTSSFSPTLTSSFTTLTLFLLSNGEADSSCNLICSSLLEHLELVPLMVSRRDRGNPFFLVSIN